MEISIFEVIGPVMVGPSSSHTAGACRLGYIAAKIAGRPFSHVAFGLHGSFAKTYKGHGTDRALVAGVLDLREDDERISSSFTLAKERGLRFEFYEMELDGAHENTVSIRFTFEDNTTQEIIGASVGGGNVAIRQIDGVDVDFSGQMPTIIARYRDVSGVISKITTILAGKNVNIATMKVSRKSKGQEATCVIETDTQADDEAIAQIAGIKDFISVRSISIK